MKFRPLLAMSLLSLLGIVARAEALKVGADAPVVTATTDAGTKLNLADVYKQNDYTLVWFYPRALTGGCTKQGCSLRDGWADLQKAGVSVLGVSTDDEKLQKEFKEEQNFPFRLLADKEKKAVTEAFGVKNLIGMAGRSAFLFKDGKCVYADNKGHTGDQAKVILDFLASEKK